jgi:UDP-N-acetylglucosamine 2-epimerase (non-hydrolysing)
MPAHRRLLFLFGTRPEVIKLAPVIRAAQHSPQRYSTTLLHTGQHRELAEEMLAIFGLTPDISLEVMQPNQDFFSLSSRLLERLGGVFQQQHFDMILTQGDTSSVFLGALAGYYTKTPVGHIEAGLRTHDKFSPYPEEMNRRLAGVLADLHFPPTVGARDNLLREGIPADRIVVTGNTVIDALLTALDFPYSPPELLQRLFASGQKLVLVTTHRRENFGEPHRQAFRAFLRLAQAHEHIDILFPVHPNPNVRQEVSQILENHPRIHLTPPLGYLDFIHAMKHSHLILTDSGGVQEEAPTLKKPVLVLRENTERPEGVETGALALVGTDPEKIFSLSSRILTDPLAAAAMTRHPNPYGDGHASERILSTVDRFFST